VVAIHGDGGYLMNAHELETAVRHGINVVTIVMNNNCWGSEKAYQREFYGGRYIGCDIGNPRYDAFARLFGAEGYYAETPAQVGEAVTAALACGKPAVVEIPIDPDELPTPVAAIRREGGGARVRLLPRAAHQQAADERGRQCRDQA
jgi:acetolactate synthase-1/2/3 large subunit/sulfoacetaldehyde acetyltransferase